LGTPVTAAMQEIDVGGSQFEPRQKCKTLLENNQWGNASSGTQHEALSRKLQY
jgi:hypothetical protein